jgi:hypothetical protein
VSIWIDHRQVTSIANARPVRLSGFLAGPQASRRLVGVPGRLAPLVGEPEAADARRATMTLRVPCATLADRPAALSTIKAALGGAIRLIRTADRPGLVTRCVAESITPSEQPGAPGLTIPAILIDIVWLAIDGGSLVWPAPGPILLGTTRATIPVGSLVSGGWLYAWGGSSPLTITTRSANGARTATCVITQTLATGEHLACDLDTGDVWYVTASGRSVLGTVVGEVPTLDPADVLGAVGPSLQLSSGTGLLVPSTREWI